MTLPVSQPRRLDIGPGQGRSLPTWAVAEPVDILALHHCTHELGALALFSAADRVLHAQLPTTLLVHDHFVLQRSAADVPGAHALDTFLALAERMGWTLAEQLELGRRGPQAEVSLRFERAAAPTDRLHPVTADDAGAMQALFAHVFGHALSPAQWHWKYGQGRGFAVGLSRGAQLVAHYGGSTRQVLWLGRPALACQVCDVMVAPEANAALVRKGPMFQVTTTFLETELGWGHPHVLAFGFPTDRHHVLARRLRLYDSVDSVVCASWPAAGVAAGPRRSLALLAGPGQVLDARQRRTIDRLWQRMAAELSQVIVGVRDADWVQHRYLMHPTFRYDLHLLRRPWTGRAIGLLVTRRHERHLEVLDMIGAPADFGELITLARQQAVAAGLERVECWITESQRHRLSTVAADACTVTPLNITVPANVHTPAPAVEALRGRWLLMAGDTDFR